MTAHLLITLDLLAMVLAAAAWIGAGVSAAARRADLAGALGALGLLLTVARIVTVAMLSSHGWWFVQEKLELELPAQCVTAAAAAVLAGPRLLRALRERTGTGTDVDGASVVVPLFAAGYAAAAGIVVTLLIGFPATAAVDLVTVAVLAGAVLLTWKVIEPQRRPVRLGAAGSALVVALIGVLVSFVPAAAADAGGGSPVSYPARVGTSVAKLAGPTTPQPGGTVRRYRLDARTATITLASGQRLNAWTFNGQVPGPPITATEGDLIEVTLHNTNIASGVTIHWHGYDVPSAEDGAAGLTQDVVQPGGEYVYRFVANQVGTYWYHTHEASDQGVHMGLYGALVVTPRAPSVGLDLTLPVHTFTTTAALGTHDDAGNAAAAPGTGVRLRLINTDNQTHRITLAGAQYRLAAVDGHDLNSPGTLERTALRLAAGGRYDVEFPMPAHQVALLVDDDRTTGLRLVPGSGASGAGGSGAATTSAPDTSAWPELDLTTYGAPGATAAGADRPISPAGHFDRRFTVVLDRGLVLSGGTPGYDYTINGEAFPAVPTLVVRQGDLVLLTVVNRSLDTHPWHLHGHAVQVLAKDGRPVTGSTLTMDTFEVRPGEVWQVAFRADNPGLWMVHCHNLDHADHGMTMTLAYAGVTDPFGAMRHGD
jgi:FtsP/CotA-like multicopper oxidase with cupredoxin domain